MSVVDREIAQLIRTFKVHCCAREQGSRWVGVVRRRSETNRWKIILITAPYDSYKTARRAAQQLVHDIRNNADELVI